MNFLTATIYDIFLVSRGEELKQLVNSIDTLQEYNQMNDSDSEGRAVELMLENEHLSIDDVEEFATQSNYLWINSEKEYSHAFDSYVDGDIYKLSEFDKMKGLMLQEGLIHQLQYDSYEYVGKYA